MLTRQVLVIVLLLVPTSLSSYIKTTCEIPSVEAGDNTTLTIHFGEDLMKEQSRDFSITHLNNSGKESTMLNCQFNNGTVDCDNQTCCSSISWERKVMDVFRVHMHSASQDLEGKFWGLVIPAETEYQKFCIFTLKASSCSIDSINARNSNVTCSSHPVTIGQNCTVNCNPDYFFQENQTFVTYTCVGKNTWVPENPVISCEASTCSTDFIDASNSQLSCTTQPVTIGQTCKVTCTFDQEKQFSVIYTCVGKNKWSPELPVLSCEGQPKSHNSNENYLLVLLLFIIPVIIVIVIGIVIWKRHKEKVKKDQTENDEEIRLLPESPEIQQSKEDYLLQCIKNWYPELQSRTYFFPPFPSQISQNCDVHDRRALDCVQRVLQYLCTLADNSQQVMMVISLLHLSKCLGKPNCTAAVVSLPSLSLQHYDQGHRCVLIIHSNIVLLWLHITCMGDDFSQLTLTEQDGMVTEKVKEAVIQLNNENVVLLSDLPAIKRVTKILVLPNISSSQLLRAITGTQDLCQCLGVQSVDDALKLCLLSDQLLSSSVNDSWWQHVIEVSGPELSLTSELYEQLVARFCGEAATVEVHYNTAQTLNIRTLEEAVSDTGERVARFVLFPQQVDILNQSPRRAFLTGPPGTGKTIVLIMQGLAWLQRGYDVHVVSTCDESRAVTIVIEHQLQETAETPTARSRVHRHQFDFLKDGDVETAVRRLKRQSEGRQLCVIADEVMPCYRESFTDFLDQLISEVPTVYIWGTSMYHGVRPSCMEEVKLTTPLRSPPVVVREVMESDEINNGRVDVYMTRDVPSTKDGPTVINIQHKGQPGHTIPSQRPEDCVECGHKIAHVLKEGLKVGRTGDSNVPPSLQYRDVLVLCFAHPTTASGLVQGLRDRHVPVRVVEKGDEAAIRDTALGVDDLVTVASWGAVRGLQRKVVVVASGTDKYDRLHAMSRCTSQLVVIDREEGVID